MSHGGYTMATRRPREVVYPSQDHRQAPCVHRIAIVWSTIPVSPMTTRSKDDGYTNPQDGHTMATRWTRRTHEVYTKLHLREDLRQFFDMPKILWALPKLLPNPKNLSRWSHDGLRCSPEWPDVFTIIPDVANFLHRVSIGSQNRDSVTPA